MSTKNTEAPEMEQTTAVEMPDPYERVDIYIERPASSKDDPNLFVSVNGRNFILPKGKTSSVPRYIYDEIVRSRIAQAHLDDTMRELKARAAQPTAM